MRHVPEVDAIIVGAGPAGAITALLLARAGHAVALLDRRRFPRAKACGDCLSAEAARVLDRVGLLAAVEALRPARLVGWRIISPGGWSFASRFDAVRSGDPRVASAISLARDRLDAVPVEAARRAGADVRFDTHVIGLTRAADGTVIGVRGRADDGAPFELRARIVIGADGLRSTIARRLRLVRRRPRLRKVSLTAHLRGVHAFDGFGEMHLAAGACAGLAPVETTDGGPPLCNLTLVVTAGAEIRDIARDPVAFFRAALERFPRLAGRLRETAAARDAREPLALLASGPFDWPTRDVVADGAALVGDAAGYYDPFTGQGIYQALASAEILAEEADHALRARGRDPIRLRRYAERRTRLLRGARALQRGIEFVTARPRLADAAIRRIGRAPRAAAAIIAATADLAPVRALGAPGPLLDLLLASPAPRSLP